jgi:predicted extracellular nuclease
VTTRGFVTAAYPSGGFAGFYLQTPGTGGAVDPATHLESDAIFVFTGSSALTVSAGDYLEVTGKVTEYNGLTELSPASGGVTHLDPGASVPPSPASLGYPGTDALRESLEGMLLQPQGDFTVTGLSSAAQYGEIELATGTSPLLAPTSVGAVGSAAYAATVAANLASAVWLDDGASTNFSAAANTSKPLPYLSAPVRVGSAVTFTKPVVLDYRNGDWRFQPTTEVTGANETPASPVSFTNTRTAHPADVGGTIKLGTFNVLNFFPTTGDSRTGCTFYNDRAGNPVTVNNSDAPGCGVRGAATQAHFAQQESKIVTAILALGANVISLEEIENSAKLGMNRDHALGVLVDAINAADGGTDWKYVASPPTVPSPADEDVIRTGFIYRSSVVKPVGDSTILVGPSPFDDAREPDAQAFAPIYGDPDETFVVVSNHFKSKTGTGAAGDNVDAGQGAYNGDRTRQAQALLDFAAGVSATLHEDKVFLVGDFNSLNEEDPVIAIRNAGYTDLGASTGKASYSFDGEAGSLDHIFASPTAAAMVTGTDIWNINSVEAPARQYSYVNANVTNFLNPKDPYRSSDHDPLLVGLNLKINTPPTLPTGDTE